MITPHQLSMRLQVVQRVWITPAVQLELGLQLLLPVALLHRVRLVYLVLQQQWQQQLLLLAWP
jgi:hypothetical protein